ncbi:flagellar basal-body rod protein FlgF [Rhodopila globiformis]|uniref:Flagellar basal-body rod protein FlgF n=1 Tax=Rhodopila globiformis TaxID=1071 RepID=A0A2S6MZ30_RHOGL|nr:flagellar basal-body rod protein FlgF [Rhodopila globiformis]PPQ27623.1 flagellar basal-body rod protein FlgF [Rhodopila globiformis]
MEAQTYVTLSAQLALQKQLEVVANNVANANSAGFKPDRQLFQSYVEQLAVPGDQIAFVQDRATYIDQAPGPMEVTGNMLDVAINGDGYLSVQTPSGPQYTRDGRLHAAPDSTLVDHTGRPVLNTNGTPIQLPQGYTALDIKGDGTIYATVNNATVQVDTIGMSRPTDPMTMRKSGDGLLTAPANGMQPIDAGDPHCQLIQGSLEGSTVQPVTEIANMTELSRAYEQLQTLLSDDNDREQKMIETLGTPAE